MALTIEQQEMTDELVRDLKEKYEKTPQKMTTGERFLLMVAGSVQYFQNWDRYDALRQQFRADVTARLNEMEKVLGAFDRDKVTDFVVGDKWDEFIPQELEDLTQSTDGMWDLLERIYELRGRWFAIAQKKGLA